MAKTPSKIKLITQSGSLLCSRQVTLASTGIVYLTPEQTASFHLCYKPFATTETGTFSNNSVQHLLHPPQTSSETEDRVLLADTAIPCRIINMMLSHSKR